METHNQSKQKGTEQSKRHQQEEESVVTVNTTTVKEASGTLKKLTEASMASNSETNEPSNKQTSSNEKGKQENKTSIHYLTVQFI